MSNVAVQQDNFNDTLPAVPTGQMNAKWQADTPPVAVRNISAYVRNHGGVDARSTTTETIGLASQGKIVTLNAAGAVAVTLDSTVPATFMAYVTSEGAGGATLTPSSGLIDNAANLALFTLQGVALFFDGTNWWTERGMGAGGSTGVLLKTGNYTTSTADNGKLISFNLSANATLTLPAVAPPATWSIEVENTEPAGLLAVDPNGLMLDQSTSQVPIPSPHGMRIFSNGSNYYTERGMPDDVQQPCSNLIDGVPTTSNKVHGLIASFATTTPGPNFGFRQAAGDARPITGFVETTIIVAAGSTLVVSAGIQSNIDVGSGLPYTCTCTYTQGMTTVTMTQLIRESDGAYGNSTALMFYAANVPAGVTTVRVQIAASSISPVNFLPGVPSPTCVTGGNPGYLQGDWYGSGGEYFVNVSPGCTVVASADFEPMRVMSMALEEIGDAGSGVSVLGVNHGVSPVLPVATGSVPCPPVGFGWATSSAFDTGPVGVSYDKDPGWNLRIVSRNAAGFPHFDDQSLALFDGFPCCGGGASGGFIAFNQTISDGTNPFTQRPTLAFEPPLVPVDDPTNNATDVKLELGGVSARTTTAETIDQDDYGFLVTLTNASPIAVTLDSTVPNWFYAAVQIDGTGTATLTPSSGNINGSATATISGANSGGWLFFDGTNWWFLSGGGGGGGSGLNGVSVKSADYSLASGDNGKLITLSTGTHTFTLPNPPPSSTWAVFIENYGTGTLTVSRNSLNIDGAASNLTILQNQGVVIFTDGSNYFTERGLGSVGAIGGDLAANSSTSQEVIGILNKLIDGSAPTDGQILQYSSTTGKWEMLVDRPIFPVSAVVGKPTAGQLACIYTAASSMIFPANFATPNSYGTVGANPSSSATYTVLKNGSTVGTVVISTGGAFTFATTGGTSFTLNAGDRLTITAPNPADTTLADVGITLVGTRSATVPSALGQGIFIWRGTYNNSTTYNINDVVAYTFGGQVQSYICIAMTTGNIPTNTSFWNLMAQAGAAGGGTVSGIQQEAYTYAADSGTANAYVANVGPTPTRIAGSLIVMKAAHANTGASTLDDGSGSGATAIKKNGSTALVANDIVANEIYMFVYDGTNWQLISWPGVGGGDLTAKYIIGDTTVPADLTNAKRWVGLYNSPDMPPVTATAYDDEFDVNNITPSGTAQWSWVNQGSATANYGNSWVDLDCPSNSSAHSVHMLVETAPSPTWTFTCKFAMNLNFSTSGTVYATGGLLLRESATGKLLACYLLTDFTRSISKGDMIMNVVSFTNATTLNAARFQQGFSGLQCYMRWKYDGTNVYCSISIDGNYFIQCYTAAKTVDFTTAPDQVGIMVNPYSNETSAGFEWIRKS